MSKLKAVFLAVILLSAIAFIRGNAEAANFVNSTGLASPVSTITFDEIIFAQGTNVTTQYSAYGVTFTPALVYDTQGAASFPGISGHYLGNFPPVTNPFSINFAAPQTSAAFGVATNPTTTTFTALLNGNTVETFTTPTDFSTPGLAFVGFTDILFNEIQVTVGGGQIILIDNIQMGLAAMPPTCAYTMNMPTSPANIGTFTPGIYMSYDPMVARPFGLEEAGGMLTGRLSLPCWRNGHADIYIVLDAPAYGGKFMLSELHQWLPFPANIQPWQTYTDDGVYAALFSLQKSGILPGNYKLDVIVVPSGTAASTIDQIVSGAAAAPYYKWSFTETLP